MPVLNYVQTLDMVEVFMKASGIRNYCTNICKGDCCGGCYTNSRHSCHEHEGRRISCSTYLCYFETTGINGKTSGANGNFMTPFRSADRVIVEEASRIYHKYRHGYARTNSYYYPPPKQIFTEFEITAVPIPDYLGEGTSIETVRAGLSLAYASKVKVIMNKVTRLAREILEARDPNDSRKGVRLSMFDVRRKKIRKRHVWQVKHYGE